MPSYDYYCDKCDDMIDVYHSIMKNPDVICEACGKHRKRQIGTGMVIIKPDKPDRYERSESAHKERVKDPERARRMRKKKFGTEGISITKSPYYHKEKRVKAQGTSQEVDKKEFVKSAARNPNAMKAAIDVLNKKK